MHEPRLQQKLALIAMLYFIEGLPFGIVKDLWPLYFRQQGISLTEIGMMSLLGLPWTFKVFWSPLIDRIGHKRYWIAGCLMCMATILALLTMHVLPMPSALLWIALFLFTTASATQDIAIDAWSILMLRKEEQGYANGIRSAAYRVAILVVGGGLAVAVSWLQWTGVWLVSSVLCLICAAAMLMFHFDSFSTQPTPAVSVVDSFQALVKWCKEPSMGWALAFVLVYRLGDVTMGPMVKPFWLDRGFTVGEIGLVSTSLGLVITIAGALTGGAIISKIGLYRSLWILGILQALSNFGYGAVASFFETPIQSTHLETWHDWHVIFESSQRFSFYAASMLESFTSGLGSAAFLAFLMRLCQPMWAATQYATLSALSALVRDAAGSFSGQGVTMIGYSSYFMLTGMIGLLVLIFLPKVKLHSLEATS